MGGVSKSELKACASATEVTAEDKRIMIFPMGRHYGRDGRGPYELRDIAHANQVIATTRNIQGSTLIALDYDHQFARAVEPGEEGKAVASGWISADKLVADAAGIWAEDPEWTATAKAKLDAKEYRYLSPWFGHLKDGPLTRIINAALVNRPNLEIAAVAAELPGDIDDMKELEPIALALGLTATASADEIVASIGGLKAVQANLTATASALGLSADANAEQLATAATDLKARAEAGPDISKFVPIEQVTAMTAKLGIINEERATAAVDAGIKAGKLVPALRDYWVGEFKRDETAFASMLAKTPVILKPGVAVADREVEGADASSLTAEETAMCSQHGWDPEEFLAQKKQEAL